MNPTTILQLEERAEQAVADYLRQKLNEFGLRVDTGFSAVQYSMPGVYVTTGESDNTSELHGFNGYRSAVVSVDIRSNADVDKDSGFTNSRNLHAGIKSRVMFALAQDDLVAKLNALAPEAFAIDRATITGVTRGMDTEDNYFQTVISLEVDMRPIADAEDEEE
jgi:hypothetical protein